MRTSSKYRLIGQEAFMAAAPFIVNHDKQMYVNFSTEFDMQPYSFMYRRRGILPKFLIFVYPFTPLVNHASRLTHFLLLEITGLTQPRCGSALESLLPVLGHFCGLCKG